MFQISNIFLHTSYYNFKALEIGHIPENKKGIYI